MLITTRFTPGFVPADSVVLIGIAVAGALSVGLSCHIARQAPARQIAPVAYPIGETRSKAESEAQIEGMSLDAENALIYRTDFYFHHGDYPRIIALDRIITEIDPQAVDTYSTGGWLMESDGDNAEAEAYYSLGMLRNPSSSDAAFSLAMFYVNTVHEYKQAEDVLVKSVHDPDAGVLDWKLLAHTYERENRYDKAVETWKTIQRKYPKAPAIAANLNRDEAILASGGLAVMPTLPTPAQKVQPSTALPTATIPANQ